MDCSNKIQTDEEMATIHKRGENINNHVFDASFLEYAKNI